MTQHQARLAFADATRMVEASPALRAALEARVGSLSVRETGAFLKPISSEKRGLDGKRVMTALVDEVHEADEVVVSKVRLGTKGNRDALILETTNAGYDRETICWKHHVHSRDVLTGLIDDPSWFAFLAHLDACERCQKAGRYQPADDCDDCDDWRVEGPHWPKANPGLDSALHWEYLHESVREAVQMPSARNLTRRLNFCQWTRAASVWLPPEAWHACADPALREPPKHARLFIGMDTSSKLDLSAVSFAFERPDALPDATASTDPTLPTGLSAPVDAITFFWMPEATMERRANEDGVQYPEWERAGWLFTTPGDLVDHDAILEFVLGAARTYILQRIGIDAFGATAMVTRLMRELGDERVVEIPQGFRVMSEPTKLLEGLVVSRRLRHPGNPVLDWNMSNLAVEKNRWQEIRPMKISARQRIDGSVSLIIALACYLREPAVPEPSIAFL